MHDPLAYLRLLSIKSSYNDRFLKSSYVIKIDGDKDVSREATCPPVTPL